MWWAGACRCARTPIRRTPFGTATRPRVIYELEGEAAERLIPAIRASIRKYPYSASGSYHYLAGTEFEYFRVLGRAPYGWLCGRAFAGCRWARIIWVPDVQVRPRAERNGVYGFAQRICGGHAGAAPKGLNSTLPAAPSALIPMTSRSNCRRLENSVCGIWRDNEKHCHPDESLVSDAFSIGTDQIASLESSACAGMTE